MRKYLIITFIAVLFVPLFLGCGQKSSSEIVNPSASPTPSSIPLPTAAPSPTLPPDNIEQSDPIHEQILHMSIDEKLGQLVVVGLDGKTVNNRTIEMLAQYHVGGFILYKHNISSADQTRKLLNQLKDANETNPIPLWLSVDQEGGKVNRLPKEIKAFPEAYQLGLVNQLTYTSQIGLAIGETLRLLGFNMNYAPVLDIHSNPSNPVIGNRSFGNDPQTVIDHGIEMMTSLQEAKVAAVVKHFPGHGDTYVDSHLELPVIDKSLDDLLEMELLPFIEAIEQDADAMMIGHLLLPQLDEQYPASLSYKIITELLRNKLGYDGVIITDDMTMGGITKHRAIDEAAIDSILAGTDILLIGHDYKLQTAVLEALKRSMDEGTLAEERIDESVYRILQLKAKYHIKDTAIDAVDVTAINQQIQDAENIRK